jgi:hypothetical protein
MDTLVVKIWPISITGSDKVGTGAAVLVVVIVLVWMSVARPPFIF